MSKENPEFYQFVQEEPVLDEKAPPAPPAPPQKRKASDENSPKKKHHSAGETKKSFRVETDIKQICSKEDVEPRFLSTATHIAMFVGDGHTGAYIKNLINKQYKTILRDILSNGPNAAVAALRKSLLQQAQADYDSERQKYIGKVWPRQKGDIREKIGSGAMFAAALYNKTTRTLFICSLGDCTCNVYKNNKMVFRQDFQDVETVTDKWEQEMTAKGMEPIEEGYEMSPRVPDACKHVYLDFIKHWIFPVSLTSA
jgi:hypothetical protein